MELFWSFSSSWVRDFKKVWQAVNFFLLRNSLDIWYHICGSQSCLRGRKIIWSETDTGYYEPTDGNICLIINSVWSSRWFLFQGVLIFFVLVCKKKVMKSLKTQHLTARGAKPSLETRASIFSKNSVSSQSSVSSQISYGLWYSFCHNIQIVRNSEIKKNFKQAGAELCQAQVKLEVVVEVGVEFGVEFEARQN